ncbi:MAG: glycosyltransferase family 9 protein [Lentisphaerae bacterium]|nr:glycosyltransferase family 9 protein [Lentisphaerota bacterium]
MNKNSNCRILVIKLSSMGDLFHPLPALRSIKEQLNATIDWVVQPEYKELVGCFDDVSEVIAFPRRNLLRNFRGFCKELRSNRYDMALDFQGLLKSALITRFARVGRVIGPSFQREGASFFYSEIAGTKNKERHAVDECKDFVKILGLVPDNDLFPISFKQIPLGEDRPRIALIPGARWNTKRWPVENFARTGAILSEKYNASLYLFGSSDESSLCDYIADTSGYEVLNFCGKTSICEMGSYLAAMDLVICNDSGPMHMAAALGKPLVAVFGPTDPSRTGPYGAETSVLTSDTFCRPCFSRECAGRQNSCIKTISVESVINEADKLLNRNL